MDSCGVCGALAAPFTCAGLVGEHVGTAFRLCSPECHVRIHGVICGAGEPRRKKQKRESTPTGSASSEGESSEDAPGTKELLDVVGGKRTRKGALKQPRIPSKADSSEDESGEGESSEDESGEGESSEDESGEGESSKDEPGTEEVSDTVGKKRTRGGGPKQPKIPRFQPTTSKTRAEIKAEKDAFKRSEQTRAQKDKARKAAMAELMKRVATEKKQAKSEKGKLTSDRRSQLRDATNPPARTIVYVRNLFEHARKGDVQIEAAGTDAASVLMEVSGTPAYVDEWISLILTWMYEQADDTEWAMRTTIGQAAIKELRAAYNKANEETLEKQREDARTEIRRYVVDGDYASAVLTIDMVSAYLKSDSTKTSDYFKHELRVALDGLPDHFRLGVAEALRKYVPEMDHASAVAHLADKVATQALATVSKEITRPMYTFAPGTVLAVVAPTKDDGNVVGRVVVYGPLFTQANKHTLAKTRTVALHDQTTKKKKKKKKNNKDIVLTPMVEATEPPDYGAVYVCVMRTEAESEPRTLPNSTLRVGHTEADEVAVSVADIVAWNTGTPLFIRTRSFSTRTDNYPVVLTPASWVGKVSMGSYLTMDEQNAENVSMLFRQHFTIVYDKKEEPEGKETEETEGKSKGKEKISDGGGPVEMEVTTPSNTELKKQPSGDGILKLLWDAYFAHGTAVRPADEGSTSLARFTKEMFLSVLGVEANDVAADGENYTYLLEQFLKNGSVPSVNVAYVLVCNAPRRTANEGERQVLYKKNMARINDKLSRSRTSAEEAILLHGKDNFERQMRMDKETKTDGYNELATRAAIYSLEQTLTSNIKVVAQLVTRAENDPSYAGTPSTIVEALLRKYPNDQTLNLLARLAKTAFTQDDYTMPVPLHEGVLPSTKVRKGTYVSPQNLLVTMKRYQELSDRGATVQTDYKDAKRELDDTIFRAVKHAIGDPEDVDVYSVQIGFIWQDYTMIGALQNAVAWLMCGGSVAHKAPQDIADMHKYLVNSAPVRLPDSSEESKTPTYESVRAAAFTAATGTKQTIEEIVFDTVAAVAKHLADNADGNGLSRLTQTVYVGDWPTTVVHAAIVWLTPDVVQDEGKGKTVVSSTLKAMISAGTLAMNANGKYTDESGHSVHDYAVLVGSETYRAVVQAFGPPNLADPVGRTGLKHAHLLAIADDAVKCISVLKYTVDWTKMHTITDSEGTTPAAFVLHNSAQADDAKAFKQVIVTDFAQLHVADTYDTYIFDQLFDEATDDAYKEAIVWAYEEAQRRGYTVYTGYEDITEIMTSSDGGGVRMDAEVLDTGKKGNVKREMLVDLMEMQKQLRDAFEFRLTHVHTPGDKKPTTLVHKLFKTRIPADATNNLVSGDRQPGDRMLRVGEGPSPFIRVVADVLAKYYHRATTPLVDGFGLTPLGRMLKVVVAKLPRPVSADETTKKKPVLFGADSNVAMFRSFGAVVRSMVAHMKDTNTVTFEYLLGKRANAILNELVPVAYTSLPYLLVLAALCPSSTWTPSGDAVKAYAPPAQPKSHAPVSTTLRLYDADAWVQAYTFAVSLFAQPRKPGKDLIVPFDFNISDTTGNTRVLQSISGVLQLAVNVSDGVFAPRSGMYKWTEMIMCLYWSDTALVANTEAGVVELFAHEADGSGKIVISAIDDRSPEYTVDVPLGVYMHTITRALGVEDTGMWQVASGSYTIVDLMRKLNTTGLEAMQVLLQTADGLTRGGKNEDLWAAMVAGDRVMSLDTKTDDKTMKANAELFVSNMYTYLSSVLVPDGNNLDDVVVSSVPAKKTRRAVKGWVPFADYHDLSGPQWVEWVASIPIKPVDGTKYSMFKRVETCVRICTSRFELRDVENRPPISVWLQLVRALGKDAKDMDIPSVDAALQENQTLASVDPVVLSIIGYYRAFFTPKLPEIYDTNISAWTTYTNTTKEQTKGGYKTEVQGTLTNKNIDKHPHVKNFYRTFWKWLELPNPDVVPMET